MIWFQVVLQAAPFTQHLHISRPAPVSSPARTAPNWGSSWCWKRALVETVLFISVARHVLCVRSTASSLTVVSTCPSVLHLSLFFSHVHRWLQYLYHIFYMNNNYTLINQKKLNLEQLTNILIGQVIGKRS